MKIAIQRAPTAAANANSAGAVAPSPGESPRRDQLVRPASAALGRGSGLAWAALIVGVLYAAVSVYWGVGGTWLLNTVGGSLERGGRAGDLGVMLAVWAAVAVKLIAAGLPLIALRTRSRPRRDRVMWALAWAEAIILTVYGLALTVTGLLVQAAVIHAPADADHRALAWHAYLWDPWFLIWGVLVTGSLLRHRRVSRTPAAADQTAHLDNVPR